MLIAFVVVLTVATLGILVVMMVSLVRQVTRLAGALKEFQEELTPVVEQIRRDADRAGIRLERLSGQRARPGGKRTA
jgi:predicted PurR-regulated permease PerM